MAYLNPVIWCHTFHGCNGHGRCYFRGYGEAEECHCDPGWQGRTCNISTNRGAINEAIENSVAGHEDDRSAVDHVVVGHGVGSSVEDFAVYEKNGVLSFDVDGLKDVDSGDVGTGNLSNENNNESEDNNAVIGVVDATVDLSLVGLDAAKNSDESEVNNDVVGATVGVVGTTLVRFNADKRDEVLSVMKDADVVRDSDLVVMTTIADPNKTMSTSQSKKTKQQLKVTKKHRPNSDRHLPGKPSHHQRRQNGRISQRPVVINSINNNNSSNTGNVLDASRPQVSPTMVFMMGAGSVIVCVFLLIAIFFLCKWLKRRYRQWKNDRDPPLINCNE